MLGADDVDEELADRAGGAGLVRIELGAGVGAAGFEQGEGFSQRLLTEHLGKRGIHGTHCSRQPRGMGERLTQEARGSARFFA